MGAITNKCATLSYQQSGRQKSPLVDALFGDLIAKAKTEPRVDPVRKAILDAFAAFEPEAISLEVLAFETELPQSLLADALGEMIKAHEVLAHIEDFVFLRDGTESNHIAFPVNDDSSAICRSKTMYRINHEWKEPR